MTSLRTTVLMKTDIVGSTPHFRALLADNQQALMREHRAFIVRLSSHHDGAIVGQVGDGFWVEFPSVTTAAIAAIAMQEALRLEQPIRGDDRLSMRIVIGVGDIGNVDGEMIGELLVLIVRIEAITPADEIYLTPAARLILMSADVQTSWVDVFELKGFAEAIEVYRVEQRNRACILPDAFIVIVDLRGFTQLTHAQPVTTIERTLTALDGLVTATARHFGGTIRYHVGDSYCLTFPTASQAVEACERLVVDWDLIDSGCSINIAAHRGSVCAFQTFLYGNGINVAAQVQRSAAAWLPGGQAGIFVTDAVRQELDEERWASRLVPVSLDLPNQRVHRL
jgi:adenylate cyclase